MTVVSILLITSIYRIRVNHYKFQYGIYMSFGADYRQLCKTSFWEMMVVSLATFIPSQLFSTGVVWLIYRGEGFDFGYNFFALLKVFLINIIIVAVSVCFPMWRVSRDNVTNLIVTEDNSNLVTSPRRSFDFTKLTFPRKYELASMWRFRKYLAVMIVTAVGFSAVFVGGFYVADLYAYCRDYKTPQFTAELTTSSVYDDTLTSDLAAIEGVEHVAGYASADALSYRSHTLYPSSSLLPSADMVTPQDDNSFRATSDVNYVLADKSLIDALSSDLWDYKVIGDPHEMLTDESAVIVTNYIGNKKVCDFKVGDTIKVGAFAGREARGRRPAGGQEPTQAGAPVLQNGLYRAEGLRGDRRNVDPRGRADLYVEVGVPSGDARRERGDKNRRYIHKLRQFYGGNQADFRQCSARTLPFTTVNSR